MRLRNLGRWAGAMAALGVAWLVAGAMAWPGAAWQADPELRAMCARAERIVHGVVEESVSAADPPGEIWTTYTIRVEESIKGGAAAGSTVEVRQPGGIAGDYRQWIPGTPHFSPGEEVILFTRDCGGGWQSGDGGDPGCLRVRAREGSSARRVVGAAGGCRSLGGEALAEVKERLRQLAGEASR